MKDSRLILLDTLARWGLALIFLWAGIPKLFAPNAFAQVVGAYGLLPDPLILPVAVILPAAEVLIAFGLLVKHQRSLLAAAALLVLFIAVLSYGILLGLDIDCGCFGPEDPEHEAFAGLRLALGRDILLGIPLSFSIWYNQKIRFIKNLGEKQ